MVRRTARSLLVPAPAGMLALFVVGAIRDHAVAADLVDAYLPAAHAVLHGHSPYATSVAELTSGTAYVYPPLTAWLLAPLVGLGLPAIETVAVMLMLASVAGALGLLGVRDGRCYLVVLLWLPVLSAVQTANIDLPLLLVVAALWRFRERTLVAGLLAGLAVALKLFAWPLLLWLAATRRFSAAAAGAVTALVLVVTSWAPIGFSSLVGYPSMLDTVEHAERGGSYTLAALLAPEFSWGAATAAGLLAGLAVLSLACRVAWNGDERRALSLAVLAMLMLSPIVWLDFFALLVAVVALRRPAFGRLWLVPLVFWLDPAVGNGAPWQTALGLLVLGLAVGGIEARERVSAGVEALRRLRAGQRGSLEAGAIVP